ncbi:MAG TPA: DNA polymerase III subunit delta' [Bacteroidetes bacterium]|nr:DNA polymerase III subunit delta' [Bacteroidota bacterium]
MDLFSNEEPSIKVRTKKITASKKKILFNRVIGQSKAKFLLEKAILNERIPTAYLFYGQEGSGKNAMAIEFSKALNCTSGSQIPCQTCDNCRAIGRLVHPDLKFVFAAPAKIKTEDVVKHIQKLAANPYLPSAYSETAGILIDQVRELKRTAGLKLYKGKYRAFIISGADRMTTEAANSLLKILEEPPPKLLLILITSRLDKLLPTIISRCQLIKFSPLKETDIVSALEKEGIEPGKAKIVSRLSMGNFRKASALLEEDYNAMREQAWLLLIGSQNGDDFQKLALIEKIAAGKSRGQIKELFHIALLWLRDLQVLRIRGGDLQEDAGFYNADQIEKLARLNDKLSEVNLDKTIVETENSIDLIERNVYINLILINYVTYLFDINLSQQPR